MARKTFLSRDGQPVPCEDASLSPVEPGDCIRCGDTPQSECPSAGSPMSCEPKRNVRTEAARYNLMTRVTLAHAQMAFNAVAAGNAFGAYLYARRAVRASRKVTR